MDDNVPRIHTISNILLKFSEKLPEPILEARFQYYDRLAALYLEGRYPDYSSDTSISKSEAQELLQQTKEEFAWLLTLKP